MRFTPLLVAGALALAPQPALQAQDASLPRWVIRVGVHPLNPDPDAHVDYSLDSSAGFSVGTTYLFTNHWAVEVFAAFPKSIDMRDADGTRIASFKTIPLAATVQYHVADPSGTLWAYVGAGVSHAMFTDEHTSGTLEGQAIRLPDSTGLTAVAGLDLKLGSKWFASVDARWMDIDTAMNATNPLSIDPFLFGLSVGRRFR
jgi:outer membrane protein W